MIKLELDKVNFIDLTSLLEKTSSSHTKNFLVYPQGEHYKLLAYISSLLNNAVIFDIGTHHGSSALALSVNKTNKIISYDILNQCELLMPISNIELNIGNAAEDKRLIDASLILLDTAHDGIYEANFIVHLLNIGYKGILILDDIFLCPEMKAVWEAIDLPKYDLTYAGHNTGTGLIDFGNNVIVIESEKWLSDKKILESFEENPFETIKTELGKTSIPKEIITYLLKCVMLKFETEKNLGRKLF